MTEWRNVKDIMPGEGRYVLISDGTSLDMAYWEKFEGKITWRSDDDDYRNVKYWASLPKTPAECGLIDD